MAQQDSDLLKIKKLIKIMKDNDLIEVEVKHEDDKILLKRFNPHAITSVPMVGHNIAPMMPAQQQASVEAEQEEKADNLVDIKSPIVGTFYATPSPDSDLFVEIGSHITPQTVVCIIEAMKVMNEIKAETAGTIAEILVTNGQAVEYGQPLFSQT